MTAKKTATKKRKKQRGKPHEDPVKAQVIAALLLGAGVMEVASELGLPHSTVSTYKGQIPEGKLDDLRRKKGERLDEMVYDFMLTSLTSLRKQAELLSDASFIYQQGAHGMATLYGVMADKAIRLLEVSTRPRPTDSGPRDSETKSLQA
jgi:hypothetical protein